MSSNCSSRPSSLPSCTSKKCGVKSFASLSRNALYTSLNSYIANSETKKTQKNINTNVREKSLYSFLENVSIEYHSPASLLGKNGGANGGQPLNFKHMEKKASQRALTLIGGGCDNSSFARSTTTMVSTGSNGGKETEFIVASSKKKRRNNSLHFLHGSLSKRQRKTAITRQLRTSSKKRIPYTAKLPQNEAQNIYTKEILVHLNEMWNQYINSLLKHRFGYIKAQSMMNQEIATLLSTAEMIGSHVIIVSESKYLSDRVGIIVDVTKNTWRIASPFEKMINEESKNSIKSIGDDAKWRVLVVPKERASLVCCVQFEKNNKGDCEKIYVRISTERRVG